MAESTQPKPSLVPIAEIRHLAYVDTSELKLKPFPPASAGNMELSITSQLTATGTVV